MNPTTAKTISDTLSLLNGALILLGQTSRALQVIAAAQAEKREITQAEWDESQRLDQEATDALNAAIVRAMAEGR